MKKVLIITSTACILAIASVFIMTKAQKEEVENYIPAENMKLEEVEVVEQSETEQVENTAAVHEMISNAHTLLNNITGFGNHEKYADPSSAEWDKVITGLQAEANQVEKALEYADETVKEDLENFIQITRHAADSQDHTALLYSHRIIHDVDTVYNDKDKKTFKAAKIASWGGAAKRKVESLLNQTGSDE